MAIMGPYIAVGQTAADRIPNDTSRPNILWVYLEDTNPWMSCYGEEVVETPNINGQLFHFF